MTARRHAAVRRRPARSLLAGLATSALWLAALRTAGAQAVPHAGAVDTARPLVRVATPVRVRDAGPGLAGRMLRDILARPHLLLAGDSTRAVQLRRDTSFATTVVVLGGDATVAARVRGDVVVIGGDLYLRPGAVVEGRAIAYGGGVYESGLGIVRGHRYAYRDETFAIERQPGEITLAWRDLERHPVPTVAFPAGGVHLPEYTRVDGVALPWGPTITLLDGGMEIVPTVTYRSHLGAVDPRVDGTVEFGRRNTLTADVGRGTFSNDRWIRGDLVNSFTTLFAGVDTRNYYRADRADVRLGRLWETATSAVTPFVGARVERAWSTGPDTATTSAPWSVTRRRSREAMLRPNPRVVKGTIASALVGAALEWESPQQVTASVRALAEQALDVPAGDRFTQGTLDVETGFPTFGTQSFELQLHTVLTAGAAVPQRFAYLGGNGTLLTRELLDMGGDQLLYVESRYNVPVERVTVPFLGPPIVTLRHAIGSAGVGRLPSFTQNLGLRLTVGVIRFDYTLDPATRKTKFDVSFAMTR